MRLEEYLPRKSWKWIFLGSLVWFLFLLRFGSYQMTLNATWADSVSNIYSTWIFWDHGLDIYDRPTGDFLSPLTDDERSKLSAETGLHPTDFFTYGSDTTTSPIYVVWESVPRPYPPGLYLYLTPTSILHRMKWLDLRETMILTVGIWIFVAHLVIFVFLKGISETYPNPTRSQRFWIILSVIVVYFEIMRWTMNSEYDAIAVLASLLAVRSWQMKRPFVCLFLLGVGFFLHLRNLFYLPLLAFALWQWIPGFTLSAIKKRLAELSSAKWFAVFLALAMSLLAFITMKGNAPFFKLAHLYDLNGLHWSKLGPGNWPATLLLTAGLLIILSYWWKKRLHVAIACTLWLVFMLMQTRLLREWYILFFLPLFLLALNGEKRNQNSALNLVVALGALTFLSAMFLSNSPFEFRLIRELVEAVSARW